MRSEEAWTGVQLQRSEHMANNRGGAKRMTEKDITGWGQVYDRRKLGTLAQVYGSRDLGWGQLRNGVK